MILGRKILVIFVKSFISFSRKEISALFSKKSDVKKDFNGKNKSNLDKINSSPLNKILGFIFLLFSFYAFYYLSIDLILLIFVILISISTDIGGYIFGKFFKGPKLTKISPNKTYAGMIGGYFLSLSSLLIIINIMDYNHIITRLFLITILISTVSQVGDIIISYFKRLSKIKNTGKIIPGHGGLLDRIDGMIFSFPIYYIVDLSGYLNL